MHEASVVLTIHPPALTRGAVRVEISQLTAVILQRLLKEDPMVALPNEQLKLYLNGVGMDFPDPLQLRALIKQLREDMRLVGVDNPVLQVGGGLMLNRHVKVICDEEDGPDLLDVIYTGLMPPQRH
ncbi:hypothetical protein [Marinospirillum alkaliphilum]|uniref:Uncharacterized protein n=1 Tax=Marinospirillum alkaliphilum DSM 21637 TaxID=1122209 RepID=A0A1K1V997_9GAMM|nr:hypothetical protein [Marinospirillum alkaliphilum]SFX21340.1 hypothetical protein SAMN02745752_00830 [Marinospirillum alkaliphilum DSM 21637]